LEARVLAAAQRAGADLTWFQSNAEGDLVDAIQQLPGSADGAIINAAAYSHTSLAVRDALLAVRVPFIEVHLSNIFARDEARRHSLLADLALAVIAGLGPRGYEVAVDGLVEHLRGG
jgi:3-dehydroquinate dehydratase-2